MFHHLTRECADLLIGSSKERRSNEAWKQVYRALDHGFAKSQCKNKTVMSRFPREIENFANVFATMQAKRHSADYDPSSNFTRSGVTRDIDLVEQSLQQFSSTPVSDRRAFCAFILFKERKI